MDGGRMDNSFLVASMHERTRARSSPDSGVDFFSAQRSMAGLIAGRESRPQKERRETSPNQSGE